MVIHSHQPVSFLAELHFATCLQYVIIWQMSHLEGAVGDNVCAVLCEIQG